MLLLQLIVVCVGMDMCVLMHVCICSVHVCGHAYVYMSVYLWCAHMHVCVHACTCV